MRLIVKQTECAGNMFWIVKDMNSGWFYHGPFVDEASAHAFARPKNSADWKALLNAARMNRKALATEESIEEEAADIAA